MRPLGDIKVTAKCVNAFDIPSIFSMKSSRAVCEIRRSTRYLLRHIISCHTVWSGNAAVMLFSFAVICGNFTESIFKRRALAGKRSTHLPVKDSSRWVLYIAYPLEYNNQEGHWVSDWVSEWVTGPVSDSEWVQDWCGDRSRGSWVRILASKLWQFCDFAVSFGWDTKSRWSLLI